MRNTNLLLICLLLIHFSPIFGQHIIHEKINQHKTVIQQAERFEPLEEISSKLTETPISDDLISKKQFFQLKEQALNDIRTHQNEYLRLTIPIEGQNHELHLMKAEIFTSDFRLEVASAPGMTLLYDRGIHYRGTLANTPNSLVAISFFEDEINGFISFDNQHFSIGKINNSDKHILYEKSDFNETFNFECRAIPEENPTPIEVAPVEKSDVAGCVRIHIEADYSLFQDKNSSTNETYNYIVSLFAQTAILYANEGINVDLSFLRIWDTPSPYGAADPLEDLNNQEYGKTYGDLVHLIHTINSISVAYVNVICRTDVNTGVSGVNGWFFDVPTYSWDVSVLTHELGHNLGSSHTHSCVWNGNGTQIDDCGNYILDVNDISPGPGPCYDADNLIYPSSGTIMSYCHLVGEVGIDFNNGFGEQPGNLIRSRVNAAACLVVCQCNDGIQNGNETGVDCGGDCMTCPTCDDGIMNGDEIAIDCGGTNCTPCVSDCSTFDFNTTVFSYDPGQDFGTYAIQDGGTTLYIQGNVWKAVEINYTFTEHTVLEFDFKSTIQGEIHELNFDNDLALPTTNRIVTYGTQGYSGDYDNSPYDGNGDYTHYVIDLGFTGTFQYLILTADDDANAAANSYFRNIQIYEDYDGDFSCAGTPTLDICAQLEGTYNPSTNSMSNTLETMGMLPQNQPYNQSPWNYYGTEQKDIDNVVDWVLVSLRTGVESNTQVVKTAALLQTDGCIYFPDNELLPAGFNTPVYVVVEHRNHMGVMSPQPVHMVNNTLTYDFRASQSYKNAGSYGQKQFSNGSWCMYAGDINPNDAGYDINGGDKSVWVSNNGTFNEYLSADLNQDSDVNGADKAIWYVNNGFYSIVPK